MKTLLLVLCALFLTSGTANAQTTGCAAGDPTCAINALTDLLNSIFMMPDSTAFATVWALGFTQPLVAALVAWGAGVLLKMFDD